MSRSIFGWDLPPGVTSRMIDEQLGDGIAEAQAEAIFQAIGKAGFKTEDPNGEDDPRWDTLATKIAEMLNRSYTDGHREARSNEAMASEAIGVTQLLRDLARCPLLPQHEAAEDDRPLFGMGGWHLTVGHIRAARRSQP